MSETIKDLTTTCGTCGIKFKTDELYFDHTCPITGFTPREPQHFGKRFMLQQKKALERGGSLTKKKEKEIDDQIEEVKKLNVDHKIMTAEIERKK